jgi:hypothetical protein
MKTYHQPSAPVVYPVVLSKLGQKYMVPMDIFQLNHSKFWRPPSLKVVTYGDPFMWK